MSDETTDKAIGALKEAVDDVIALRATVARLERELEQCRAELEYERSRR